MEEVQDRHRNAFEAYLKLQAESYELVLRNLAMHRRLSEAYELIRGKPEVSTEETYRKLKDEFEAVYQDLFTMFFRPFRLLVEPYGELFRSQFKGATPEYWFEQNMDLFRMWVESHTSFLKGIADVYRGYLGEPSAEGSESEDLGVRMRELTPANLLRSIFKEGSKAYLETVDKYLESLGGTHQLNVPKAFFIHLRNGVSSYSKMYVLWSRYESMLHDAWGESRDSLLAAIVKSGKPPAEMGYEEFYGMFMNAFVERYDRLLKSDEFVEAQNDMVSTFADVSYNFEKTIEAQLDIFPVLPFAPRSEIDTIEKRIYDYGRALREMERDVRGMKEQLKTIAASEELAELSKRVEGMERQIRRLSRKAAKEAGER